LHSEINATQNRPWSSRLLLGLNLKATWKR